VALLGNPNCGKTALFNLLTGSRHKLANYAGVSVKRPSLRSTVTPA
jgi:ferrous iron transport protein B